MFYLENNTTFSGADIKVYAYRNPSDFSKYADLDEKKVQKFNTDSRFPNNPFVDMDAEEIDLQLAKSLEGLTSPTGEIKQKLIKKSDGTSSLVKAEEAATIEQAYTPPVFKELTPKIKATFPFGSVPEKVYEGDDEDELDRLIAYRTEENARRTVQEVLEQRSIPRLAVPTKALIEPDTQVTFADGRKEIVSADKAADISAKHIHVEVEDAPSKIDQELIQTNKVNPNYIDIVKAGSDKAALKLARDYQQAKQNRNRNEIHDEKGNGTGKTKPIIELGSLYSITYSSFREKHAVRTLGRVSAKDYTRGQRTIAGSMNFAIFQSHELMDFLKTGPNAKQIVLLDQLPKFNLMFIMINEYGGASILHLFNVTISTESQQTSVDDLALMNQVTFYAEDIMTIENVGNIFETSLSMLHPTIIAGKTLRFYDKNDYTTLGSLMSINNSEDGKKDGKINSLLSRSRGLF